MPRLSHISLLLYDCQDDTRSIMITVCECISMQICSDRSSLSLCVPLQMLLSQEAEVEPEAEVDASNIKGFHLCIGVPWTPKVDVEYPEFIGPHGPTASLSAESMPIEYFLQLFSIEMFDDIVDKTEIYAHQ